MANTQSARRREILTLMHFFRHELDIWPLKLYWQPRKGCGRAPRKVTLAPFCANSSASNAFNSRQTTDAAWGQFGSGNLELTAVTRPTAIEVLDFRKWLKEIKFISWEREMRLYANSRFFYNSNAQLTACTSPLGHSDTVFHISAVRRCSGASWEPL